MESLARVYFRRVYAVTRIATVARPWLLRAALLPFSCIGSCMGNCCGQQSSAAYETYDASCALSPPGGEHNGAHGSACSQCNIMLVPLWCMQATTSTGPAADRCRSRSPCQSRRGGANIHNPDRLIPYFRACTRESLQEQLPGCENETNDHVLARQAAARQQAFDSTAVGKAIKKSVVEAKRPSIAEPARESRQAAQNAQDWLS